MKKTISSLSIIVAAAAVAIGGTMTYFSDTEISTMNVFAAESIDLKVDNICYYNNEECALYDFTTDGKYHWMGDPDKPLCACTWELTDITDQLFFDFTDLKPGDFGEDVISLHIDSDAWGKLTIDNLIDSDNGCAEPELSPVDPDCLDTQGPGGVGELRQNLLFRVWLDQGATPGFQGIYWDIGEGDNIYDSDFEPMFVVPDPIDLPSETWYLADGLSAAYDFYGCGEPGADCPGLTSDGHMAGDIIYYFGVGWQFPATTGNIAQGDTFVGDMTLQAVQYENNIASGGGPIGW